MHLQHQSNAFVSIFQIDFCKEKNVAITLLNEKPFASISKVKYNSTPRQNAKKYLNPALNGHCNVTENFTKFGQNTFYTKNLRKLYFILGRIQKTCMSMMLRTAQDHVRSTDRECIPQTDCRQIRLGTWQYYQKLSFC